MESEKKFIPNVRYYVCNSNPTAEWMAKTIYNKTIELFEKNYSKDERFYTKQKNGIQIRLFKVKTIVYETEKSFATYRED